MKLLFTAFVVALAAGGLTTSFSSISARAGEEEGAGEWQPLFAAAAAAAAGEQRTSTSSTAAEEGGEEGGTRRSLHERSNFQHTAGVRCEGGGELYYPFPMWYGDHTISSASSNS